MGKTLIIIIITSIPTLTVFTQDVACAFAPETSRSYPYIGATVGLPGLLTVIGGYSGQDIRLQAEIGALYESWAIYLGSVGYQFYNKHETNLSVGPAGGFLDLGFGFGSAEYSVVGMVTDFNSEWFHIDAGLFYGFHKNGLLIPKINIGYIYIFD